MFVGAIVAMAVVVGNAGLEGAGLVPYPQSVKPLGGTYVGKGEPVVTVDASVPKEGYRLRVTDRGVSIVHSDAAGLFYAHQTLAQLKTEMGIPCVEIEDSPAYCWRGLHLDESRHFFGVEVVKRMLDRMSEHKLNVFHWHLTDSQAWRVQIDAFPKLTEEGSKVYVWSTTDRYYRVKPGVKQGEMIGPDFYTKAQVKEIVDYAAARHITVVPEIDFPGHSMATMRCYPELKCQLGEDKSFRLFEHDVCPGNDFTYTFFEKVLDEICEMFPSEYIHIGGDEANMKNWKQCPRCQALVKRENLPNDSEALQHRITQHFADYLAKKGRKVIGWSEVAKGGTPPRNAAVMSWQGAQLGMPCVLAPAGYFYFDYEQDITDDPVPNYFWGWATSLERAYSYTQPVTASPEQAKYILGGEATSWTEMTVTEAELEWKLWPRACAVAELWWTKPPKNRDFKSFAKRVEADRRRMIAQGVNCAPVTRVNPVREAFKPWITEGPFLKECKIAGAASFIRRPDGTVHRTYIGWEDMKKLIKTSSATRFDDGWTTVKEGDNVLYLKSCARTTKKDIEDAKSAWLDVIKARREL